MKNKILFASVLALATTTLQAQDMYDVARLSTSDLQGTARYIGMGGAMGALGADLTILSHFQSLLFMLHVRGVRGTVVFTEPHHHIMFFAKLQGFSAPQEGENAKKVLNFCPEAGILDGFHRFLRGRSHGGRAVGRADAGREHVQRTVCARVAVATHHKVAARDAAASDAAWGVACSVSNP